MSEPERGDRAPAPGPGEAERAPVAGATPVGPPASEARPAAGSEPAAPAPGPPAAPAAGEAAPAKVATPVSPAKPAAAAPPAIQRGARPGALAERPEVPIEVSRRILAARSRRDFLLLAAGIVASAAGAWWLLPDRARSHLAPGAGGNRLDRLAGRLGLTRERGERALDRALDFDDDIAEALYSKGRRVRTYDRSQVRTLRNNYHGRTPGPEYLPTWSLAVTGLASAGTERLALDRLLEQFALHEQVTRLVCVEGWSTIAWWGGIRFADFLAAFPPAPGARWAALRSSVGLDTAGRPEPYYVSIDLETARHPQTLLATHQDGRPLTLTHGAPLRLVAPMKLGLKNIKAVTDIAYSASEPPDYWNEQGYSKYDGL